MKVQVLYWEECPSHEEALARLRQALREEGVDATVEVVRVETPEDAVRLEFPGRPRFASTVRTCSPRPRRPGAS